MPKNECYYAVCPYFKVLKKKPDSLKNDPFKE